jgi:hypothetical protein
MFCEADLSTGRGSLHGCDDDETRHNTMLIDSLRRRLPRQVLGETATVMYGFKEQWSRYRWSAS